MSTDLVVASSTGRPPVWVGIRLGALYGPAVYGVSAASLALTSAGDALRVTDAAATWILTGYALALGIGTALGGRVCDALGTRATALAGAAGLLTGTGICLIATTLAGLVAGRCAVAAGSGVITAVALSLAAAAPASDRVTVLAALAATVAVYAASATLIGAWVTAAASWRLTVALPALSLLALPTSLRLAGRPRARGRVDVVGAALLAATISAALLAIQAPTLSLPPANLVGIGAGLAASIAGLGWWTRRVPNGFVPQQLLTAEVLRWAALAGAGIYGATFAALVAVPHLLLRGHHWSVLSVGWALLPGALLGLALSRLLRRHAATRAGGRVLAAVAVAFAGALATAGATGATAAALVAGCVGLSAITAAQIVLTAHVAANCPPARIGSAVGLLSLMFFAGGALGAALAAVLMRAADARLALAVASLLPAAAAVAAAILGHRGAAAPPLS